MKESFLTIAAPGIGEFKDRSSRFVGYAFSVSNQDEIKQHLQTLKELNPKARHVCYAYTIEIDEPIQKANDDGEPSGSAGRPILGQIHSNELNNCLVAVVRYFGGTKLGVAGLINAYKMAAIEALNNTEIITKYIGAQYILQVDYAHFHEIMNYLKRENVVIDEQTVGSNYVITVTVEINKKLIFEEELEKMTGVTKEFIGYND